MQYRRPVFHQRSRVDHHTDRDEEYRREHILERRHELLNAVRLDGLGENRTHYKSAKGTAEARLLCRQNHAEAETESEDNKRLVVQIRFDFAQKCRNNKNTKDKPYDKRNSQNNHFIEQFGAFKLVLDSDTGEQNHEHDRHYVFNNQNARSPFHEALFAQSGLVNRLHNNSSTGHTEHTRQKERVHHVQAGEISDSVSQRHHSHNNRRRSYSRHFAALQKILDPELQTDTEKDEEDTDVTPRLDVLGIVNKTLAEEIRPHNHSGYNIAEHNRLFQQFEEQTDDAGSNH